MSRGGSPLRLALAPAAPRPRRNPRVELALEPFRQGPSTPERVFDRRPWRLLRWEPRREGPANPPPHRHLLVVTRGVVADTPELDAAGAAGALERVRRSSGLGRRIVEHVIRLGAHLGAARAPTSRRWSRCWAGTKVLRRLDHARGAGFWEARTGLQLFNTLRAESGSLRFAPARWACTCAG